MTDLPQYDMNCDVSLKHKGAKSEGERTHANGHQKSSNHKRHFKQLQGF